jgi:menaquinol-cytochrome c reductase iron-sulfur subunit
MERRSFLKLATHGLGALCGVILGLPALAFLFDSRNRKGPESDFKTVARLSDLPKDLPVQVVIRDLRSDAWTLHPNDVIGRIWLIRRHDDEVDAFTTICPHLGCSINFEKAGQIFICPCHNGTFELTGRRKENISNPAPRGMDRLECRRDPINPDFLQVKYQNFRQGEATPILKS